MSVLYIVLPLALIIASGAVAAFVWMVRQGGLDDLETPAHRILHDDEPPGEVSGPEKVEPSKPA